MIYLDSSTLLEAVLAGAMTTSNPRWDVSYGDYDQTNNTFTMAPAVGATNGTSAVTMVAAPGGTVSSRQIKRISLTNTDTAPITVTIRKNAGGTLTPQLSAVTLQVGERIEYTDENGFSVYTVTGAIKVTAVQSTVEPGYIDGFRLQRASSTQLDVTSGTCYIPSVGANVASPSTISKTALALTPNTTYHVYFGLLLGVPDIELSTTAPATPYNGIARTKTGDTSRRYIGSIRANAGGGVTNFLHTDNDIFYQENILVAPFLVLSGGVATVATTVALGALIPATSRSAIVVVSNSDTGQRVDLGNSTGALGIAFANPSTLNYFRLPTNTAQEIQYAYFAAPGAGSLSIRVSGYQFER